eukprot:gene21003-21755_t
MLDGHLLNLEEEMENGEIPGIEFSVADYAFDCNAFSGQTEIVDETEMVSNTTNPWLAFGEMLQRVIDFTFACLVGPLTLGKVQDIEELGVKVVLCPWHKFMVNIRTGVKAYQGVEVTNGVPVRTGWKVGDMVQRAHEVREDSEVSTEEIHNAKVDSANEPASTLSSNEGKDAGEIMARCASDGDASD